MARQWLARYGSDAPWRPELRFDAVAVELDADGRLLRLDHMEGAFRSILQTDSRRPPRMRCVRRSLVAVGIAVAAIAAVLVGAPAAAAAPRLGAHRDRLVGRLVHLGRGRPLAGQQHEPVARPRRHGPRGVQLRARDLLVRFVAGLRSERRQRLRSLRRRPDQGRGIAVAEKVNLACSGATTENVFRAKGGKAFKGESPQGDQLLFVARALNVKAVVLSIGGTTSGSPTSSRRARRPT